jgi:hypothetical protein
MARHPSRHVHGLAGDWKAGANAGDHFKGDALWGETIFFDKGSSSSSS